MPPLRPTLLLLDFDGTLTLTSTIPLLLSLSPLPYPHPALPSLLSSYTTDLQTHTSTYIPKPSARTTVAAELTYLASLESVERGSIERLEEAGVWRGVTRERIEEVARGAVRRGEVRLRSGWEGLVKDVQGKRGGKVGVVSVAWSGGFIRQVLREGVRMKREEEKNEEKDEEEGGGRDDDKGVGVDVGEIDIRANEIVFDAEGRGTGKLDRHFSSTGIWTSSHKLHIMHSLISNHTLSHSTRSPPRTIYIGDSTTDLACLIEADVGICMRDEVETGEQRGLREVLERVGVECFWIGEWKGRMGRGDDEGRKGLWWARDFEEVRRGMLQEG